MQKAGFMIVFLIAFLSAGAMMAYAQTYDVVLWDSPGPYFSDVRDVGGCSFALSGTIR